MRKIGLIVLVVLIFLAVVLLPVAFARGGGGHASGEGAHEVSTHSEGESEGFSMPHVYSGGHGAVFASSASETSGNRAAKEWPFLKLAGAFFAIYIAIYLFIASFATLD